MIPTQIQSETDFKINNYDPNIEIKENHFFLEMLEQSNPREDEFFRDMTLLLKKPESRRASRQNTWSTA